ncbi:MAG: helix-turn-helix transcriptional regulator [Actinobacteria bacterium]|nr:helix-turn-helix transcriptional regulator [Actinomycetota bacterium]
MDDEEARAIGQRLRMIRRRRGLGLTVAAGLAGISKPYLSMLERGERGFNRRGLLEDLAAALSCSVADLTGQPYHLPDRDIAEGFAAVPGIQLALNRSEDLALIGFARWYWALGLMRLAARRRAVSELTAGVDELAPAVVLDNTDATLPAEMAGLMHLTSAQTAAREQRGDDAHAHLAEAATLAVRIGERNGMRQHFGPTNVALWRLGIGVELGEGGRVYEEVTRAPIDVEVLDSAERSSSLHLDLARALMQEDGPRDGEAIRHLDAADRLAPQRIRMDPIARDLLLTLDRRALRRVWELDSLRNRFGIGKG